MRSLESILKKGVGDLPEAFSEKYLELFMILAENSLIGVYICNNDHIVYVNETFANMVGYESSQMYGMKFSDIFTEETQQEIWEWGRKNYLNDTESRKYETQALCKDSSTKQVELSVESFGVKGGLAILGTVADIQDKKNTENSLDLREKQYRSLNSMLRMMCDNVPDMIWAKDLENKYLFANKAMCDILLNAKNTQEPIGKTDMFFAERERQAHPDNPNWHTFGEICRDSDSIVIKECKPLRFDEFGCVKGEMLYLDVFKAPFWNERGHMIGTVGCGRIVTEEKKLEEERKSSEKALRESERRYKSLFDGSKDGIVIIGKDGAITECNESFRNLVGYGPGEMVGSAIRDLFHDSAEFKMMLKKLHRNDSVKDYSIKAKKKNGDVLEGLLTASVSRSPNGEIFGYQGSLRDVTVQKRLESQLFEGQKMKAIGTLAGGIAHDFNNILYAIMGYTELAIEDAPKDANSQKYLQQILKASKRARDLIAQILAFSRQTEHEKRPMHVAPIISEVVRFLRATIPANIEIQLQLDEGLPPIMGDPTNIHQVAMNLCTNAAHAMGLKGGELRISLNSITLDSIYLEGARRPFPGDYLQLSIEDTGPGMSKEVLNRIFEPYFTTKEQGQGTGLGLAVVHGIVVAHDGFINAQSDPSKGSRFQVYLPTIQENVDAITPEAGVPVSGTEKILLVDDEDAVLDIVETILIRLGYKVEKRQNGLEALELFKNVPNRFDLVITDMSMPKMTGLQLAKQLLSIRQDIPIILCTGFSELISDSQARSMGIKAMLLKPVLKNELSDAIRKALGDKKGDLGD